MTSCSFLLGNDRHKSQGVRLKERERNESGLSGFQENYMQNGKYKGVARGLLQHFYHQVKIFLVSKKKSKKVIVSKFYKF